LKSVFSQKKIKKEKDETNKRCGSPLASVNALSTVAIAKLTAVALVAAVQRAVSRQRGGFRARRLRVSARRAQAHGGGDVGGGVDESGERSE
jgi:hypothetical protein